MSALPQRLVDTIARLPTTPGVYLMRSHSGEIVYVGKATNLRSRVRSYFSGTDPRPFVRYLDELLGDVEFVLSANPKEALLLENTLIKKHKPRFNFMLRDDKNYLAIRVDERVAWPRVELVRQIRRDGARYFGPYHSAAKVRQTLNVLNRHFNLRTCTDSVLNNRSRPCLQYQIRRCPAPCVLAVKPDDYRESVKHAVLFLAGRADELEDNLQTRMLEAAERLEFEEAARFRDQLAAVAASLERQGAVQTSRVDRDVVGLYREADDATVTVMTYRSGALGEIRSYALEDQLVEDDQIVSSFLSQYYAAIDRRPPAEVLIPRPVHADDDFEQALSELRGSRCAVLEPKRGEKRRLVELANENAKASFRESLSTTAVAERALARLADRIGLRAPPRTIECYDVSNFQGDHIVASRVVFQDAMPDRARYRRVKIRATDTQDDFASIHEVLTRRLARVEGGEDPLPDLVVIDGGKGQLAAALDAAAAAGFQDLPIVALAKSRALGTTDDGSIERSQERVFAPGRKNPIMLQEHSPECRLLARIRDEAHRTAIQYHRSLRNKATLRSRLDDIPGVGPSRRASLLSHFGTLRAVREASVAELAEVRGFDASMALKVYMYFHPEHADPPA